MNRYDRDFTKPVSSKGVSIYEINITPLEMEMFLDLQPFVNPTPYIVPEDMSLTKVRFILHLRSLTKVRFILHLYSAAGTPEIFQHFHPSFYISFPNVEEFLVDDVNRQVP